MKNSFAPSILIIAFVLSCAMRAQPQAASDQIPDSVADAAAAIDPADMVPGTSDPATLHFGPIFDPIAQMSLGTADTKTGEIIDEAGIPVLGEVNSPEKVSQRLDAILQVTDPVQYLIDHPLTPEQQASLNESLNRIQHPKTLQEHLAELTPEDRAKEQEIIAAFLGSPPVASDQTPAASAVPQTSSSAIETPVTK